MNRRLFGFGLTGALGVTAAAAFGKTGSSSVPWMTLTGSTPCVMSN